MLPPALLDLTLTRLSHKGSIVGTEFLQQWPRRTNHTSVRWMQQAAVASGSLTSLSMKLYPHLQSKTSQKRAAGKGKGSIDGSHMRLPLDQDTSLPLDGRISLPMDKSPRAVANPIVSKLVERVEKLNEIASQTAPIEHGPSFTDEELMFLYHDILHEAPPEPLAQTLRVATAEDQLADDAIMVDSAYHRLQKQLSLFETDYVESPFVRALRAQYAEQPSTVSGDLMNASQPHRTLLSQVDAFLGRLDPSNTGLSIPIVVMTVEEWEALIRISVRSHDLEGAELSLQLMQRTGIPLTESAIEGVLKAYADVGNIFETERVINTYITDALTDRQQHLHVRAHLRATPAKAIPDSALAVLHSYEAKSNFPAINTYTGVITSLLSVPQPVANAQAWDLYAHMRYVAHPNPDVFLYTTMIRACASPSYSSRSSDPERALDLWTEMTVDHKIRPTVASYNAVILSCARSGRKAFVHEAFRLAKEMVEVHRDGNGTPLFMPDLHTFYALLEAAKRCGDLNRTRWILAKIGSLMAQTGSPEMKIDEQVMMHAFHTYASYSPPFKRNIAPLEQEGNDSAPSFPTTNAKAEAPSRQSVSFAHVAPQTRSEVIAEVEVLFHRALAERAARGDVPFTATMSFGNVEMSTRLVNSYLSVHYKHGGIQAARELFRTIFEQTRVERSARSYMEALQRCAMSSKHERQAALLFARELFLGYSKFESSSHEMIDARIVESIHIAFLRVLALTNNLKECVNLVKVFMSKYPPSTVRTHDPKPAMRSTKTVLFAARPLVRMSSTTELPDGKVPPILTFADLDVLHQRFVHIDDLEGIAFVKYVCKAYEWALRIRRDNVFKAKPPQTSSASEACIPEEENAVHI